MLALKFSVGVILTLTIINLSNGQELTHDERCTIREGNGIRVDECDAKRLLQCKDGRCQCPDPASHIYTYRNEPISSRTKRSPGKKGGGFKKIAAGAVAGVATYQVAKAAGKAVNNGFTTTPRPPKYNKVFACYARVGGQCALNYGNVETVPAEVTTTTTAVPAINSTATDNSTTATVSNTSTEATPVAAAQTKVDLSKIPKCVQNAVCKPNSPATNATGFHQKVEFDPRLGVCECADGFKRNSRDLCEKVNSSAAETGRSSVILVILSSLILNKIFA